MLTLRRDDGYELSTDPDRLDVGRIHQWLSTDAYWAIGRTRERVDQAVAASVNYGVYRSGDGRQVAYTRAVTDSATFAWLCDVYVDRAERGRGLGTWMVGAARDHLHGLGVPRLLLSTMDAQGVYAKLGFVPLAAPTRWMESDLRTLRPQP